MENGNFAFLSPL